MKSREERIKETKRYYLRMLGQYPNENSLKAPFHKIISASSHEFKQHLGQSEYKLAILVDDLELGLKEQQEEIEKLKEKLTRKAADTSTEDFLRDTKGELEEENKKLKEEKNEIFKSLEKELRLHEVLNSDRKNKKDLFYGTIAGSIRLQLVLIRGKFDKFKEKHLEQLNKGE